MKARWHQSIQAVILTLALVGATSCGQEKEAPPELPPEDTMVLPELPGSNGGALMQTQGSTTNVSLARLSVGLVTLGIGAVLLVPRALFADMLRQQPARENDRWVWSKNYPLFGYSAELQGWVEDGLQVEMHVSGTVNQIQMNDFVWFTGSHQVGSGQWVFYKPASPETAVLQIDWERSDEAHKSLVFTNVDPEGDGTNDSVTYRLDGDTASMTLHDAVNDEGVPADFTVEWSTADGSGMMTAPDGSTYCWDTLDNGQVDIPCP